MAKTNLSLRLDDFLIQEIRNLAKGNHVSVNMLASHVLNEYVRWQANATNAGFMPVTKSLLIYLLNKCDDDELASVAKAFVKNDIKDLSLVLRGEFTVNALLDILLSYSKAAGYSYQHRIKNDRYTIILRHNLGKKWSVYLSTILENLLHALNATSIKMEITCNVITIGFSHYSL